MWLTILCSISILIKGRSFQRPGSGCLTAHSRLICFRSPSKTCEPSSAPEHLTRIFLPKIDMRRSCDVSCLEISVRNFKPPNLVILREAGAIVKKKVYHRLHKPSLPVSSQRFNNTMTLGSVLPPMNSALQSLFSDIMPHTVTACH